MESISDDWVTTASRESERDSSTNRPAAARPRLGRQTTFRDDPQEDSISDDWITTASRESEIDSGDLVELRIGHVVTWHEAQSQADREAGGLPTCDDLRRSGVNAGGVDLWMPVQRPDGMRGDYCQIGTWPGYMDKTNKTRYI